MIRKSSSPLLVALALSLSPISGGAQSALAASTPDAGVADPNIFIKLAKKVVPSVVNISTLSRVKSPLGHGGGGQDEMFRRFFEDFFKQHGGGGGGMGPRGGMPGDDNGGGPGDEGDEAPPAQPRGGEHSDKDQPRAVALGTGFIIDASGLILTNNHVVAGADEIKISFTSEADEKPTDGEVVGRDPELDLALIKVKSKRTLVPIALGDSDALEVGEYVMAVGNPFGQSHSVTHGIISAKGRRAPDFRLASYLQTDAPINPGNSGGPLVNLKGEVIGINNAILAQAQGIGFAIPINLVKTVLPQLKTKGSVSRGYIGVLVDESQPAVAERLGFPKDKTAPLVTSVNPGEPADKAGVKPYDLITEFNGKKVASGDDLVRAVTSVPVGSSAPMKVWRNGKELTLNVTVAQRPGSTEGKAKKTAPSKKGKGAAKVETGMELENLTPDLAKDLGVADKTQGVVVSNVAYGSPADKAGLLRGDIILEVDRKSVRNTDEFYGLVMSKKSYLLRVRRADPQGRDVYNVLILDLK